MGQLTAQLLAAELELAGHYDPAQPRDKRGQWTEAGSQAELDEQLARLAEVLSRPAPPGYRPGGEPDPASLYGGHITEDRSGQLTLNGQPVRKLYRVVDPGEWADAQRKGYLRSHGYPGGGRPGYTRASAAPDERWRYQGPVAGVRGVTLEIDYDPADSWHASAEGYAATKSKIPLHRIHAIELAAEPHHCGGCGCPVELAAWTHERRRPKGSKGGGQWTKGGAGQRVPVGVFRDPRPPDPATPWVVRAAGGAERHVGDDEAARIRRQLPMVAGEAQQAHPPDENDMTPVDIRLDPDPPGWAAPWIVRAANGAEWHVSNDAADDIQRELRRRKIRAGQLPPSPPGEMITPTVKQYILPGMPEPGPLPLGHTSAPVQRLHSLEPEVGPALTRARREGSESVSIPKQGQQGAVAIVTLPGGEQVVTKTQNPVRQDREELAYYVAQVLGVNAPAVARVGERDTLQDYVPGGQTLARWLDDVNSAALRDPDTRDDPDVVVQEAEYEAYLNGGDIGLLDYVTGNSDRHDGNVIMVDDQPVPIDHGEAFTNEYGTSSEFWGSDESGPEGGWTPQDVADMRDQLAVLEPEFRRLGRLDWYQGMLDRVDLLQGE